MKNLLTIFNQIWYKTSFDEIKGIQICTNEGTHTSAREIIVNSNNF